MQQEALSLQLLFIQILNSVPSSALLLFKKFDENRLLNLCSVFAHIRKTVTHFRADFIRNSWIVFILELAPFGLGVHRQNLIFLSKQA